MSAVSSPKNVNLQDIADAHLVRLLAYRDGYELNHAATAMFDAHQFDSYRKILPPPIQHGVSLDHNHKRRQAFLSLGANAIRDIMTLDGILFEEIRLCIEAARLIHSKPSEDEQKVELLKILERRPATIPDAIVILDELLMDGFPWMQEFRCVEKLYYIFGAQACHDPNFKGNEPVSISLCVPKFTVPDPISSGSIPFEIETSRRDFAVADQVPFDPRMNYEIFFTAYAVYRGLVEGCKKTILQKYTLTK